MQVVVGVDPGTTITGYGVVADRGDGAVTLLECGVVRPRARAPLAERLRDVHLGLCEVLARHRPVALAVEAVFAGRNARTAVILAHARGVALLAAAEVGVPAAELPPARVKQLVVGTGRATKGQVARMLQHRLRLRTPPQPADAADAVAVALAFCLERAAPRRALRLRG
mgnify:CR=1 FL=1